VLTASSPSSRSGTAGAFPATAERFSLTPVLASFQLSWRQSGEVATRQKVPPSMVPPVMATLQAS
jgi:hypothetical protein